MSAPGRAKKKSTGSSFVELVVIIVVALGLALLVQAFIVKPYRIPSESMVPTLQVGQRVLVNRVTGRLGSPKVGNITVFHPPAGSERPPLDQCGEQPRRGAACDRPTPQQSNTNFIKRIVGAPGDTIAIRGGHVIRNGKKANEPFISDTCDTGAGAACDLPVPIKVPAGHWFMMGDNRGQSDDSRFWGPVPEAWIIGPAVATYWPPDRIGIF